MPNVEIFVNVAIAALSVLVAFLACYLAMRLLGKLAKFLIIVVVIVLVIWFVFSEHSFLNEYINFSVGILENSCML